MEVISVSNASIITSLKSSKILGVFPRERRETLRAGDPAMREEFDEEHIYKATEHVMYQVWDSGTTRCKIRVHPGATSSTAHKKSTDYQQRYKQPIYPCGTREGEGIENM